MQATDSATCETEHREKEEEFTDGGTQQGESLKGLFSTSSRLVQQAANILEEEIAAGIVAAKRAERRLINVKRIRGAEKNDLMQRFRKDVHEVVDVVMDLLTTATQYLDKVARMDIRVGKAGKSLEPFSTEGKIPTIRLKEAIAPGESATVPMYLDNKSEETAEQFHIYCTDLVNAAGQRITHKNVIFEPAIIAIEPADSAKVDITVKVPAKCPVGAYSGLIQAQNLESLRAILMVTIG